MTLKFRSWIVGGGLAAPVVTPANTAAEKIKLEDDQPEPPIGRTRGASADEAFLIEDVVDRAVDGGCLAIVAAGIHTGYFSSQRYL